MTYKITALFHLLKQKVLRVSRGLALPLLDRIFVGMDKQEIRRTRNLHMLPVRRFRLGGKQSYAEWAHVIGIFQTLMYQTLDKTTDIRILDVGCGTGLLAIAADQIMDNGSKYIGIDVDIKSIDFCRKHFPSERFDFQHLKVNNAVYADGQANELISWNIDNASIDLVTALSVWTHFRKDDGVFYFREIERVLKPNGKAIITFFLLNQDYTVNNHSNHLGRYHSTPSKYWVFDMKTAESDDWLYPSHVSIPEYAIGNTEAALNQLIDGTHLKVKTIYSGNWKEMPGLYFQDVVIFEKS